jgi:hypothetical protein
VLKEVSPKEAIPLMPFWEKKSTILQRASSLVTGSITYLVPRFWTRYPKSVLISTSD